ncbi:MAG: hypothetical protein JNL80_12550 [Phycisphaerae bacterium]|nr:hypothetical protein [Phycisphaerae bacterium]
MILACDAPPAVRVLIERVVRRAGGSGAERAETARELLSHFAEALSAGTSPDAAIASFGDERRAARLLRRAIRRKRGPLWKSWWWTSRSLGTVALVGTVGYVVLAARYWLVEPTVSVNYVARLNSLMGVPSAEEEGWPLYRDALMRLNPLERELNRAFEAKPGDLSPPKSVPLMETTPGTEAWDAAERALSEIGPQLEQIRAAAARPKLGVRVGAFSSEDMDLYSMDGRSGIASKWGAKSAAESSLVLTVLPHLAELQRAARWLACDARHRANRGELDEAIRDIGSIIEMARQVDRPLLVDQLVSLAFVAMASETSAALVTIAPERWTTAHLARLSDLLGRIDDDSLRISFAGERLCFEDVLQRCFSDDGAGSGHLVATSAELPFASSHEDARPLLATLALPAAALVGPSRAEAREIRAAALDRAERIQSTPSWKWAPMLLPDPPRHDGDTLRGVSGPGWLDDWLGGESAVRAATTFAKVRLRLDLCRVGISLHRHRTETGSWPAALDSLVPVYLSELPADPFTGEPLRYELRAGEPVLWSVGPDLSDDGLAHPWPTQTLFDMMGRPAEWGGLWPKPPGDIQVWPFR